MLDAHRREQIETVKVSALCSKVLHTRRLPSMRKLNALIDYLGLGVPIVLFVMTIIVLRTHVPELAFVIVADVLTGLILLVAILKLSLGWQQRLEQHVKLLSANIDIVRDAEGLIARANTASAEAADQFLRKADEIDKEDIAIFGEPAETDRQELYRLALRQHPKYAVCRCGASPWDFHAGPCQICGGTPIAPPPVPPPQPQSPAAPPTGDHQ
jgi:mobilome CxxCx(11)CxxC protein